MKLKYFLRGLGLGILLTALILCVSYRINGPKGNVVEEAKKLGMVFPEGTKPPKSEADLLLEETQKEKVNQDEKTEDASEEKVVTGAGITGEETSDSKGTKPSEKKEKKKTKKFTVRSGLLSTSVVREMKEQGIIKDDDGLNKYLEDSGSARKIIAGTYQIPEGASFEEITKIITRQD